MKTALIVLLVNLANPSEPAALLHKTYESEAVCNQEYKRMLIEMPKAADVKVSGYCIAENDLFPG